MSELVEARSRLGVLYTRCRNDVTRNRSLVDTHTSTRRERMQSFFSLSEKEEAKERSFLVFVFLIFSTRLSLLPRPTAVSHYGSIWSAFRNLVISFDRYNLDPAIARGGSLRIFHEAFLPRPRHYGFKQRLGLRNSIIRLITRI